jgi:hypothetical protein
MQRISSEFVGFVRDTGVRAFDRLSEQVRDVAAPLRPLLRAWGKLSGAQKNDLFDELIGSVQGTAAPPVEKPLKTNIRRFDPEEVEATLPAKPKSRGKSGKKKKW